TLAGEPHRAAGRAIVLHHHRPDPRTTVVQRRRAQRPASRRCHSRSAPSLRTDQLRHAHAVEMAHEGVPLIVIQRQLGHSNLGITSIYLQGIDNAEIIDTVHARHAPMVPVRTTR
ncbi:MAG TPA: tyrosine-type recombinase/integrase, partial [Conexibacter sp.]